MNPQPQNTQNIYRVITLLIAIAIATYLYMHHVATTTPTTNKTSAASSTIPNVQINLAPTTSATSPSGTYTVKAIPLSSGTNAPAVPNYKKSFTCIASISAAQCATLQSQAVTLEVAIAKNNQDLLAWINLGTVHKTAGDYQSAIIYWQYMANMYPTNPVAFSDLADMYMNFVKDYPKAEANYFAAIKAYPIDPSAYKNLFVLYTTTSYTGGVGAAEAILKQGITANPKAVDLEVTLARYYKSLGRTADAKAEFDVAIKNAQAQGNTALASQIQQEAIQ